MNLTAVNTKSMLIYLSNDQPMFKVLLEMLTFPVDANGFS
jgi:hypothetical protein